jgi:hypothetical protein
MRPSYSVTLTRLLSDNQTCTDPAIKGYWFTSNRAVKEKTAGLNYLHIKDIKRGHVSGISGRNIGRLNGVNYPFFQTEKE